MIDEMAKLEQCRLQSGDADKWGAWTCYDDVSGGGLDPALVQAACALEIRSSDEPRRPQPMCGQGVCHGRRRFSLRRHSSARGTQDAHGRGGEQDAELHIMLSDVQRADFHAAVHR